jgi:hypothetical protein
VTVELKIEFWQLLGLALTVGGAFVLVCRRYLLDKVTDRGLKLNEGQLKQFCSHCENHRQ